MTRKLFTGLALAIAATAAPAGVYKWTDKDGKVHYSDKAPSEPTAVRMNDSAVPLALQTRLRSIDPRFVISYVGGNLVHAFVCGQTSADGADDSTYETPFAERLEATQLGKVVRSGYDFERCPPIRRDSSVSLQGFSIKFNQDAIAPYRGPDYVAPAGSLLPPPAGGSSHAQSPSPYQGGQQGGQERGQKEYERAHRQRVQAYTQERKARQKCMQKAIQHYRSGYPESEFSCQ